MNLLNVKIFTVQDPTTQAGQLLIWLQVYLEAPYSCMVWIESYYFQYVAALHPLLQYQPLYMTLLSSSNKGYIWYPPKTVLSSLSAKMIYGLWGTLD